MRLAVCTAAPNTSRFSSITEPKWQPMRIATGWPSTLSCGCEVICCCIWAAALSAASAVGKVAITSSPMVLITVPWRCSVALRMTSIQIATISRARTSPMRSYSRVDPTTSANRIASSMSLPIQAQIIRNAIRGLLTHSRAAPGRNRPEQQLGTGVELARPLAQGAAEFACPGLTGVQTEHVAHDRCEAAAAGQLARRVGVHALEHSRARRRRPPGRHGLLQLGEQERPMVSLAPEHHPVAPGERFEHGGSGAQAAVDHQRQRREGRLQ